MRGLALLLVALLAAVPAAAIDKPRDWQPPPLLRIPNHREIYRQAVIELASYAKSRNPNFVVLMRGGVELLVKGEYEELWEQIHDPTGKNFQKRLPVGTPMRPLIKVLDGLVLDGLYCGPYRFEEPLAKAIKARKDLDAQLAAERRQGIHRPPTPVPVGPFSNDPAEELRKAAEARAKELRLEVQRRVMYAVDAMVSEGRRIVALENCADQKQADAAFRDGDRDRVLTFAAVGDQRLDQLPKSRPHQENARQAATVVEAKNWLPLLKADRFGSRAQFVMAMEGTNYDVVAVDVAYRGGDALVKSDIYRMKFKNVGTPRLVLAVLPVGRAFDWRWYWQKDWEAGNPGFLFAVDDEPGAFITDIGDPDWRKIMGKYLTGIMDLGFDGVLLDDVGTYRWFEELMPLEG
ncbi:MAG: hypothetical protein ACM31L_03195 [Actinomycetota bacterium]